MTTTTIAQQEARRIVDAVQPLPQPRAWPALVVLVGSPGSGKSTVARALAKRSPLAVLDADELRELLFAEPDYSFAETQRLSRAIRLAIGDLLQRGVTVVLDANNLTAWERSPLYSVAELFGARLIPVEVTAPMNVVLERLRDRHDLPEAGDSQSAADVYHRMAGRQEPITRDHYTVDTSRDIEQFISALALDLDEG